MSNKPRKGFIHTWWRDFCCFSSKGGSFCDAGWEIYTKDAQKRWIRMLDACITIQTSLIYVAKSSKNLRKHALWNELYHTPFVSIVTIIWAVLQWASTVVSNSSDIDWTYFLVMTLSPALYVRVYIAECSQAMKCCLLFKTECCHNPNGCIIPW